MKYSCMPQGAVQECGDDEFPGIYVRLDHPSVLDFINSIIGPQIGRKKYNSLITT
jgi:hypothetical protein